MPATIFGDEFTVNQETVNAQVQPQITTLADGRLLFTWASTDPDVDGDGYGVSARIGTLQPDGSVVWGAAGEITVNEDVASTQQHTQVTVLGDGRVLFTWASTDPDVDGDSYGISARIGTVQADGSIAWDVAGEITVNQEIASTQQQPQVTALADGRMLFTWMSFDADVDGDGYGISARIGTVLGDGSIVWDSAGELTVNEEVAGYQEHPQVMLLADGRVLLAWTSSDADVDGNANGIATRIGTVQADGSIVWGAAGETTVNQEVTGFQVQPQVIALADGRVLFTWMSSDPDVDGASYGVAARVGAVQADGSIVWGAAGEITVTRKSNRRSRCWLMGECCSCGSATIPMSTVQATALPHASVQCRRTGRSSGTPLANSLSTRRWQEPNSSRK